MLEFARTRTYIFLLANLSNFYVSEEKFVCVKPCEKSLDDELDLELGAIVEVIQRGSDGWWEVRYAFCKCMKIVELGTRFGKRSLMIN